ncbi:MAG: hypothetical protein P1U34_01860 [Coxiellaceae bacterium]|nr:hypothetical protein [Coxiellaceae bacterium]
MKIWLISLISSMTLIASSSLFADELYVGRTDKVFSPNNVSGNALSSLKIQLNNSTSYSIPNTSNVLTIPNLKLPRQNTFHIRCTTSSSQAGIGSQICNAIQSMNINVPERKYSCLAVKFVPGSQSCNGNHCFAVTEAGGARSAPIFFIKLKSADHHSDCEQFLRSAS